MTRTELFKGIDYWLHVSVIVFCHSWTVMTTLLERAEKLGMTSSEYVYFYFNLLPTAATYTPWTASEGDQNADRDIFYSFKQVGI